VQATCGTPTCNNLCKIACDDPDAPAGKYGPSNCNNEGGGNCQVRLRTRALLVTQSLCTLHLWPYACCVAVLDGSLAELSSLACAGRSRAHHLCTVGAHVQAATAGVSRASLACGLLAGCTRSQASLCHSTARLQGVANFHGGPCCRCDKAKACPGT
jgi:hypothetical protein